MEGTHLGKVKHVTTPHRDYQRMEVAQRGQQTVAACKMRVHYIRVEPSDFPFTTGNFIR